uniref:Zinc finger protein n=2 Tax=Loa loa TaxID=7209 RepID=A0A1I7V9L1_LOALO
MIAWIDNFLYFGLSRNWNSRHELPDVSIPEVIEGEIELSEINQEGTRSLNTPIQEASREQTSIGHMPKKIWLKRHQNETPNIQTFKKKHPENTTHTYEKRFKCEKEDFVALPNTYVMNHTDKKPYYCPKCGKNFIWSSSLNVHKKIHTGRKSYSCSECRKNFTQPTGLYQHKKIHTGKQYSCSECGKNFIQFSSLNEHKKINSGKQYSCLECNKSFAQSGNMRRHMKVHDNAGPRFN